MRLVVSKATGFLIDIEGCKKCPICTEWFHREFLIRGYCKCCRQHYEQWRRSGIRLTKKNPSLASDTSVQAFREKYMAGLLTMKPWTWPGETSVPLGAADPGLLL